MLAYRASVSPKPLNPTGTSCRSQKGLPMPDFPRIVSAPVDYVAIFSRRFALRLLICVLLTSLDGTVIALFGPTLYRATTNHLLWFNGIVVLVGALLITLIRVWTLTL